MTYTIGGEFDFEKKFYNIKKKNKFFELDNNYTINGISSFYQILLKLNKKKVKKIFIPDLICESLLIPIKKLQFKYKFYKVDENLNSNYIPAENTAILIIHYFGRINNNLKLLKTESLKKKIHIVEDISHCYLNKNFLFDRNSDFFFSLRKHGILGPGGWGSIDFNLNKITLKEKDILKKNYKLRIKKNLLILKDDYSFSEKQILYKFKKINNSLNNKISNSFVGKNYKKNLLSFNLNLLIKKRISNWNYLDNFIGKKFKKIYSGVNENKVPLGYIIFHKNRDKLRNYLIKKRIFCGVHWQSKSIPLKNKSFFSKKMMLNSITIPIDQRYNYNDMEYIAKNLYKF